MEYTNKTVEELEARKKEISEDLIAEDADLDALETEARAINEELETRKAVEAEKVEERKAVAEGAGEVIEELQPMEERKMENVITRNSKEYIDAYADYIKTGDVTEVRALLTENASGHVAIPELVYEETKHAWDRAGIMRRVKKAYIKGNLKVGFEISATGATVHTEGADLSEETLILGTVELVPKSIKKWISISDEAMDLRGEAFLRYIYSELAYQIAKKAEDELVTKILAKDTVSTTTSVGVPAITEASLALGTVAKALSELSDEAADPVIMMNKKTWASFKSIQYGANYAADPFEGLPVEFNSSITAYSDATTGVAYAIVGDLGQGALANFPNGEEMTFKFDENSLAEKDLIKIVAREFVGVDAVAPKAFCIIKK